MNNGLTNEIILKMIMNRRNSIQINVFGSSMYPTLNHGDLITIKKQEFYDVGDILVFLYKENELLVHRLLKKNVRYYCKGDNSFRLEDIMEDKIIGKVFFVNEKPIDTWSNWQIELSYLVNRTFYKSGYHIEETKKSNIYKLYHEIILNKNILLRNMFDEKKKMAFSAYFYFNNIDNLYLKNYNNFEKKLLNILHKPSTIYDIVLQFQSTQNLSENLYNLIGEFLLNAISNNIVIVL